MTRGEHLGGSAEDVVGTGKGEAGSPPRGGTPAGSRNPLVTTVSWGLARSPKHCRVIPSVAVLLDKASVPQSEMGTVGFPSAGVLLGKLVR